MNLREHVVLGAGAAALLFPVLGAQDSAIFFGASVLIDADHYWEYLHRNGFRDWSPSRTFAFHRALFRHIRSPRLLGLNLFHTLECFLLVYLAGVGLDSSAAFAALGGMAFHLVLDLARLAWYRAVFTRALSVVEYLIRRRRLRARGIDPDLIYQEALLEIGVVPPGLQPVPLPAVDPRPTDRGRN